MSKSPRSKRPAALSPKQPKPAPLPEFEWICAYASKFQCTVEEPIAMRESLMKNSELQRCLQHSIVLSLYCTFCRRAVCASCVYSGGQHRKHRVVPLAHGGELMREDVRALAERIPTVVQQCARTASLASQRLGVIERDFAPLAQRVSAFYHHLRAFLALKEAEHLALLQRRKDQMRAEVLAFAKELDRVHQFVLEKFKCYADPNATPELLVPSRGILETLALASPFAREPRFEGEGLKVQLEDERIERVYADVTFQISQLVPAAEKLRVNRMPQSARSAEGKAQASYFRSARKSERREGNVEKGGLGGKSSRKA